MASKNDITLDTIVTKVATPAYTENFDKIDHSIKWNPNELTQPGKPKEFHRYLMASTHANSFVSIFYPFEGHNLKLTFNAEGELTQAEVV